MAKTLFLMEIKTESTALTVVIYQLGFVVTKMHNREIIYQVTMSYVRQLLRRNLITEEEYHEFNKKMLDKYNPEIGDLIADIDLI